jgi:predicted DNA-binding transcriptional regulator YafY
VNTPITSRPPLERFQRIAAALADGRHVTGPVMARQLEISPKTFHRDLEFMRDRLNLPIEFDQSRNSYYFTKPVKLCPCCMGCLQ